MAREINLALTAAGLSHILPLRNTDGAVLVGARGTIDMIHTNCQLTMTLLIYVPCMQGLPAAPWNGVVEFKRTQENAELQLARHVRDPFVIFNAHPTVAWQTTASPCAALEIVGNEMRCAEQ